MAGDSALPAAALRGREAPQSQGVTRRLSEPFWWPGWAARTRGCLSSIGGLSADMHVGVLLSDAVHRKDGAALSSAAGGADPRPPSQCPPSFQAAEFTSSCRGASGPSALRPQRGLPVGLSARSRTLVSSQSCSFPPGFSDLRLADGDERAKGSSASCPG